MRLELDDVRFSYGRHEVLRGVDLPLVGGVVGVLGPNGSGKSTLMSIVAGLRRGTGTVTARHAGRRLSDRERRDATGYVPQQPPGDVALTVLESVLVGLRRRASWRVRAADVDLAHACLADLGIDHLARRYLGELSGGQRQLAGVAQMTVRRPPIMLLDEPTSALDLHHQVGVLDFVRRRTAENDGVTLMPMHDLNLAARFCDQVLLLSDGRTAAVGPPAQVLTAETLSRTYRVDARVLDDAGIPVVTPLRRTA